MNRLAIQEGKTKRRSVSKEPEVDPVEEVKLLRTHFQTTPPARTRFLIGDILGTGTFGRVCLATYSFQRTRYFALKILRKTTVVQLKQVQHIHSEKNVLMAINHPFVVNLYATFKDHDHLYMIMDYVPGGELFTVLRRSRAFSHSVARFYAAEIVLAFEYLHSLDFVYRDLKPENLLIGRDGHIKITDFGFSKHIPNDRTYTLCGTPEYLAPEIIRTKGHGKAVDWWALGILIFEMLAGWSPFVGDSTPDTYDKIIEGKFTWPSHFNSTDKDLISRLATEDLTQRLGCLSGGAEDIKSHPWFASVDWGRLIRKQVRPPFLPKLRTPWDTSNFPRYPEEPAKHFRELSQKEQDLFSTF
jgi:protein kinase A